MRVISLAGSPHIPSRSAALLALSQNWLRQQGVEVTAHTLRLRCEDLLYANFNSPAIKAFAEQLAQADGLLISTPVYKASFSGALKTLLDLLPERALDHRGGAAAGDRRFDRPHAGGGLRAETGAGGAEAQEVLRRVRRRQPDPTGRQAPLTDAPSPPGWKRRWPVFYLALGRRKPPARASPPLAARQTT
ncbi:NAD(P)H-dependent oxidoreductase [Serratia ureilytica]